MLNGLGACPKVVCVGGGDAGPGRRAPMPKVVCVGGGDAGPGMRPWLLGLYDCGLKVWLCWEKDVCCGGGELGS